MTHEKAITAAILGELIPELEYAAPVLLERFESGDPLVGTPSPTDLGFETGAVDSVLLEFFKALVPYVKAALSCGMLGILQTWLLYERDSRSQAEQVAALRALMDKDAKLLQSVDRIADLLARRDRAPVSVNEVVELIAAAGRRLGTTDDAPRR